MRPPTYDAHGSAVVMNRDHKPDTVPPPDAYPIGFRQGHSAGGGGGGRAGAL